MIIALKIVIVAGALLVGAASTYLLKMKDDNPIEEVAEEIIKRETNIDVDLTPSSPEDGQKSKKLD
jgi:hypothetical protein